MFYLLTLFRQPRFEPIKIIIRSYMNCWPQICEDKLHACPAKFQGSHGVFKAIPIILIKVPIMPA